jgi:5-formyltetrahydrofolate cyclo-ligase
MNTDSSLPNSKLAARQVARQRRAALSAAAREAQSAAIRGRVLSLPEMEAAKAVFIYVSFRDEVETHELVRSLLISRRTVTVPKMFASSLDLSLRIEACAIHSWEDLAPGAFGILEPRTKDIYAGPINLCLAPGLAFTERGDRLGYGRGHYDEFLARHPELLVAGLAFECQIVPHLPTGPHDVQVDMLISQDRAVDCHNI